MRPLLQTPLYPVKSTAARVRFTWSPLGAPSCTWAGAGTAHSKASGSSQRMGLIPLLSSASSTGQNQTAPCWSPLLCPGGERHHVRVPLPLSGIRIRSQFLTNAQKAINLLLTAEQGCPREVAPGARPHSPAYPPLLPH